MNFFSMDILAYVVLFFLFFIFAYSMMIYAFCD